MHLRIDELTAKAFADFGGCVPSKDRRSHQNKKNMSEVFVAQFPWLDLEAQSALFRFVGWMGWHEGLIKQGTEMK